MAMISQCVVLGAGVVGLSCARRLAMAGKEVLLVDEGPGFGTQTSSRNSEVIHAGLYYKKGSLKAQLCVKGKEALYAYCKEKNIQHKRIGKVIVATCADEIPLLHNIHASALANGVHDVSLVGEKELHDIEPGVVGVAGLLSPSTGIIDSHALMLALLGDAESHGASLALNTKVVSGKILQGGAVELHMVDTENDNDPITIQAETVINSCGLNAPNIARALMGHDVIVPKASYCKGTYFSLTGRHPFRHLVYPVNNDAGLGVHVTLDLNGQVKFGPDTEWVDTIDYDVNNRKVEEFEKDIRRYWPGLPNHSLYASYSGMRPKIVGPGEKAADFMIQGPSTTHARLVNLLGIESPGLTSCLSIADHVVSILGLPPL